MQAIPNTRASATFLVPEPWKSWADFPIPAELKNKAQFEAWRTSATTNHAFISGVEGHDPKRRITEKGAEQETDNPPASMSAYIADYDSAVSDEKIAVYMADAPSPYLPNWQVKSFSGEGDSGRSKRRLVWRFARPVRLLGSRHAKQFYKVLDDRLRPKKWLDGFDSNGHKPSMYFEIGRDWKALGNEPIPFSVLLGWAAEAAKDLRILDGNKERPAVPLEKIADAVADQFPGRWEGDFARGAQGVRFWDPSADNPRGCVVGDHGMICFTGPKAFVPWEEIFGVKFVDELRGDTWGDIAQRFYWDGKRIWRYDDDHKMWLDDSMEIALDMWKGMGISSIKDKSRNNQSDLDRLKTLVVKSNRVPGGAMPFVHQKPGIIEFDGIKYLNTAHVHVIKPAPEIDGLTGYDFDGYMAKYVPWLRSFLLEFFEPPRNRPRWVPEDFPLERVPLFLHLAWVKRCYEGAYFLSPQRRQALVLAGPEGTGKTFYVRGVLGGLMGAVADGSAYMVEGGNFTSHIAERPIMLVDDATPASNPDYHRRYTAMVKKLVACTLMHYNKKYGADGMVEWRGTAILALNADPDSLRNLPSLDQSNLEKVSMFQVKRGIYLPGEVAQKKHLDSELPYFARFLLNWEPPEWTNAPDSYRGRFSVRAYHHEDLREAAASVGSVAAVLDVLQDMMDDWRESSDQVAATLHGAEPLNPGAKASERTWIWEGRASRLHKEMSTYNESNMRKISVQQVKSALSLMASREFGVYKLPFGKWRIKFDDALLRPFDPAANTEHEQ
jgi:hypothetical protein